MDQAVLVLLNGLVYGLLLFMLSSGLTLIVGMMGVLNLAHASFYMLGAYFAYTISVAVGFWPALVVAPLLVGGLGVVVERWGLRPVHRYGHVAELLFTFGLALLIGEVVPLIWGRAPVPYRVPASLDTPLFTVAGNAYPAYRLFMMLVAVLMFAALFAALARTRLGLVVRAALTHPDMVSMLGHDVPRVGLHVDTQHLSDLWALSVARVAPVVPYLLLVLTLALRPRGLLGTRSG